MASGVGLSVGATNLAAVVVGSTVMTRTPVLTLFGHRSPEVGIPSENPNLDESVAQRVDGGGMPVRRVGHADRACRRCPVGGGEQQRAQRGGEHVLPAMRGTVGGHHAHRIADPVDEVGDDQTALGEVGVLAGHPHLGRSVRIQRHHRRPRHRGPAHYYGRQSGGADRQPYPVRHVTPSR